MVSCPNAAKQVQQRVATIVRLRGMKTPQRTLREAKKPASISVGDRYKASTDAHRHYDVISQGTIIGAFAVFGAAFARGEEVGVPMSSVFGLFFILIFWRMYHVSSVTANICRIIAREIEKESSARGTYSAFEDAKLDPTFRKEILKKGSWTLTGLHGMTFMTFGLMTFVLLLRIALDDDMQKIATEAIGFARTTLRSTWQWLASVRL